MSDQLQLDRSRSWIEVLTFAEGMLSAVAHDLCLRVEGFEATGSVDPGTKGRLRIPVSSLRVRGVQRGGTVDDHAPSGIERREIERRIRDDVFSGTNTIEVSVEGTGNSGRAIVSWGSGRCDIPLSFSLTQDGTEWRCAGEAQLSLKALQIAPIWGPLRAFRVKDVIRVRWDVRFR